MTGPCQHASTEQGIRHNGPSWCTLFYEGNGGAALQMGGGMTYCATCFLRLATSCSPIEEPLAPKRAVT